MVIRLFCVAALIVLPVLNVWSADSPEVKRSRTPVKVVRSRAVLSSVPDWSAWGRASGDCFGYSVAPAGDVNGDGYGDLIVGAPYAEDGERSEGMVFVYYGSASGLPASPSWVAQSNKMDAYLGFSVAGAGDVNGDGYDDVIVGAHGYSDGQVSEGAAFVYLGSASGLSSTPAWSTQSNWSRAEYGNSVTSAGDVNGDGYDDVVVGAWHYNAGEGGEGKAYLYLGSVAGLPASPAWIGVGDQLGAAFGWSVDCAGDTNRDGFDDVIVSARSYDAGAFNDGCVFLYCGSSTGLSTASAWSAWGGEANAMFGDSVSGAGDINGDGYDDVIVGSPGYSDSMEASGRVFAYLGSETGLAALPVWTADGITTRSGLGASVSPAGDVDGHGHADVVVSAPWEDGGGAQRGQGGVVSGFCRSGT